MKKIKCSNLVKEVYDATVAKKTSLEAKKVGLTTIDDDNYTLVKLGAKRSSLKGYPDKFLVTKNARAMFLGDGTCAMLYVVGINDWFRTSPVASVKKEGKNYIIETENSTYKLERQ